MPVQCWECTGFSYWRRHGGCHNPNCWKSNEPAIEAGRNQFIPRKRTNVCFHQMPPSMDNSLKQIVLRARADNKDVDVVQVSADNKHADVGQGSADKQDADVGHWSADKSKPLAVKKRIKQKKREGRQQRC